ncbi:hypothetical protein VTO73DRAFT_15453 [Trametes versicolor]
MIIPEPAAPQIEPRTTPVPCPSPAKLSQRSPAPSRPTQARAAAAQPPVLPAAIPAANPGARADGRSPPAHGVLARAAFPANPTENPGGDRPADPRAEALQPPLPMPLLPPVLECKSPSGRAVFKCS